MTDELIWIRETPVEIKFPILVGLYTTRIMTFFFFLLLANSFCHLFASPIHISVTFLSPYTYTFDGELYYNLRFILSIVFTFIHAFCSTGIRHWRTYTYPIILISVYFIILIACICLHSVTFAFIAFLLVIIWSFCLWGISCFITFKEKYIAEHKTKDLDPYNLQEAAPQTSSDATDDDDLTAHQTFYDNYGNEIIPPIYVDLDQLKASKKQVKVDEADHPPKDYF